ncbi:LOW QUALITY PROTEIN: zinc finger FYVE domain-containing protein 26 homolog [Drosophila tropicalis]|uniref:LOW QUALITY PROTEIN: zinc finger FYVE domain-containing protein 26 homolog n=1 Tax=Drosophila tropicalis TaxID=46794 RepID=UPI0035AB8510
MMEMANHEDYLRQLLELLPLTEQQIFQCFIKCVTGCREEVTAEGSLKSYSDRLQSLLISTPYPTLLVLNHILPNAKYKVGRIITLAIQQILEDHESTSSQSSLSDFYCVLVNLPQSILDEAHSLQHRLVNRLLSHNNQPEERLMLALLARPDDSMLDEVLRIQEQMELRMPVPPTKEIVLWLAHNRREHFVPKLSKQLKSYGALEDRTLRNTLLILKLANEFAQGMQTIDELAVLDLPLGGFDVTTVPQDDLQQVLGFFYADFQRLSVMLEFFRNQEDLSKVIKVEQLLRAPGVLSLIYDYGIVCDSEKLFCLIEDTYKWQKLTPALKCLHHQEIETLSYYTALSHVYNLILEQDKSKSMMSLSAQLRQIHQLGTLCSLLEDIFQMVFLRWEQLDQRTAMRHSKQDYDEEEDDEGDDNADVIPSHQVNHRRRCGFICRAITLQSLFTFLKSFVTKKLHSQDYKCSTEQTRFQRLVDSISETLWKLGVLQKIDESLTKSTPLLSCHLELELQLVQMHCNVKEKASSDDESRERNHASSLNRRKSRKQRRAASFSGAKTVPDAAPTLEQCRARAQLMTKNRETSDNCAAVQITEHRSIIPKMLCTPEQLAIMALALKNFTDVKAIIEIFHLEQGQLSRELQFMEQQQLIKQKLATIYANYQALEIKGQSRDNTTVEQIKDVAAKGFELSKIISVVDNFSQAQKLQQSEELKNLLQRHVVNRQYSFLQQFEERNLNAIIICDLIVNLKFNREITSNLLLVIRRQQQQKQKVKQSGDGESGNANPEIGAMHLLQNLCECMRLLERAGRQPGLNKLLYKQTYPLRPTALALQLQREAAFGTLYKKASSEYVHCKELRSHGTLFQQLRSRHNYFLRFYGYMQQLTRLLQLRDPNLEYHNTRLLQHNPIEVIGDLIYDDDITPLEIESNVAALHLNLVHVISLNICPQLGREGLPKRSSRLVSPQKQETIHNYIVQHNQLLAQLLLSVQKGELQRGSCDLNFSCLAQLMELPEMDILACMHEGNRVLASLGAYNVDIKSLEHLVSDREVELRILLLGICGQGESIRQRIDYLIRHLVENTGFTKDSRIIQLVVHMFDLGERARLLSDFFTKITSSQLAKELIERTLKHRDANLKIPDALRRRLESTLPDITIYAKVSSILQFESWPQAYDFGRQTPNVIFEQLLQRQHYELCLQWCRVINLARSTGQQKTCQLILLDALLVLRDDEDVDGHLLEIVELFPPSIMLNFLDTHKDKFNSLSLLQWVINYLEMHARDPRPYRNYQLSLELLRQVTIEERHQFWPLMRCPLLIFEQLVMNSRFELLAKLLETARAKIDATKPSGPCPYCFEKFGHAYGVYTKTPDTKLRFQLGQTPTEAFMLLNFNSYQQDHCITHECLDLLLRIYASKALDCRIANVRGASEPSSMLTDVQNSLDSLCGAFVVPKQAPHRDQWIPDEQATHCMCCRRAAFTMLMRRHHCRRCGRVVCYACSSQRIRIPELYDEVEVRVCIDCWGASGRAVESPDAMEPLVPFDESANLRKSYSIEYYKWRLSGVITHDKMLREEFSYEHAPSVALSLSILRHHKNERHCAELLLYHCRNLEKLMVPNPEVDYELVAKMINCLASAGKFENIQTHSEIIMSVVQQGCESLIPASPLDDDNLRKLADALVEAEHWTLALEVHLKCGFATTGVMAAHGLACLRAGCYDAAREKFIHCMTRLSSEQLNASLYRNIFETSTEETILLPKRRPNRGPPLLQEILKLIASLPQTQTQPETVQRASLIRNLSSSSVSVFSRRREPNVQHLSLQEPALNVMNSLASLKNISRGIYGARSQEDIRNRRQSRFFEESMHYVLTYGSHADILQLLMQHEELRAALRYWQQQQLDPNLFIQHIFLVALVQGRLPAMVQDLQQLDDRQMNAWRLPLLQTCRHLEQQQQLNSLYQLQLLLNDPIRASMTCVKFYALNCENFQRLHANSQHLLSAQMHLQGELDLSQWEHLQHEQGRRSSIANSKVAGGTCFAMQMDARALNGHINTIRRQMEVTKFLSRCEQDQPSRESLYTLKILKQIRLDTSQGTLPTLFEGATARVHLCILVLLCGKNIEEGFGLAYGILQDYKLVPIKVFGATAKNLARNERLNEVERLLDCIASNNGGPGSSTECDEIISIAINAAVNTHLPEIKLILERLIKRIASVELRISSFIYLGQLKSAYLLAHKHERLLDIRKILRQAELTNQIHIKKLCERKLQIQNNLKPSAL